MRHIHALLTTAQRSPLNVFSVNCFLMKLDHISLETFGHKKLLIQFTFRHSLFHWINMAFPSLMTGDWMMLLVLITLHTCVKHASIAVHAHLSLCVNTIWTLWTSFVIHYCMFSIFCLHCSCYRRPSFGLLFMTYV